VVNVCHVGSIELALGRAGFFWNRFVMNPPCSGQVPTQTNSSRETGASRCVLRGCFLSVFVGELDRSGISLSESTESNLGGPIITQRCSVCGTDLAYVRRGRSVTFVSPVWVLSLRRILRGIRARALQMKEVCDGLEKIYGRSSRE